MVPFRTQKVLEVIHLPGKGFRAIQGYPSLFNKHCTYLPENLYTNMYPKPHFHGFNLDIPAKSTRLNMISLTTPILLELQGRSFVLL
jgi:hypothetical protein